MKIISDIKERLLSFQEISDKYNISKRLVYYINNGEVHRLANEKYPLRKLQDLSKKNNYCIYCGKEIYKGAKRCKKCIAKIRASRVQATREELKGLIRSKSFIELGKQYGVSDNAIRKWCKKYNLPSKKNDIQKISDSEWLSI